MRTASWQLRMMDRDGSDSVQRNAIASKIICDVEPPRSLPRAVGRATGADGAARHRRQRAPARSESPHHQRGDPLSHTGGRGHARSSAYSSARLSGLPALHRCTNAVNHSDIRRGNSHALCRDYGASLRTSAAVHRAAFIPPSTQPVPRTPRLLSTPSAPRSYGPIFLLQELLHDPALFARHNGRRHDGTG